jgi:hypothetical protein
MSAQNDEEFSSWLKNWHIGVDFCNLTGILSALVRSQCYSSSLFKKLESCMTAGLSCIDLVSTSVYRLAIYNKFEVRRTVTGTPEPALAYCPVESEE